MPDRLKKILDNLADEAERKWGQPEHAYMAIVRGFTVYVGDDLNLAMSTFEQFADGAAIGVGAGMVVYMMPPVAVSHMVAGFEGRPVVEAHAMGTSERTFVGCLYGVTQQQWQGRPR